LTAYIRGYTGAFDVIVSADTLVYFGPLEEVVAAAANALRGRGRLIFTVEELRGAGHKTGYAISPNGRCRHARAYVERVWRMRVCGRRPSRPSCVSRPASRFRGWWYEERKGLEALGASGEWRWIGFHPWTSETVRPDSASPQSATASWSVQGASVLDQPAIRAAVGSVHRDLTGFLTGCR
jgi:hypothetical protein